MLQYAVAMEAITRQQAEAYRRQGWDALHGQGNVQEIYLEEETPVKRFTALIRAVVSSGRVHVANMHGSAPSGYEAALGWRHRWFGERGTWEPQGHLVGWLDGINLYLEPETAYAEAQSLASAEGQPISIGAKTLWKRLGEAKLLLSKDPDHQTIRVTICEARRRVLHLDAGRILGLGEGQEQLPIGGGQAAAKEDDPSAAAAPA
jgi:hypothetical protein